MAVLRLQASQSKRSDRSPTSGSWFVKASVSFSYTSSANSSSSNSSKASHPPCHGGDPGTSWPSPRSTRPLSRLPPLSDNDLPTWIRSRGRRATPLPSSTIAICSKTTTSSSAASATSVGAMAAMWPRPLGVVPIRRAIQQAVAVPRRQLPSSAFKTSMTWLPG